MSTPVITAKGLIKRYGKTQVIHGIDLTVDEGEVVGLLGPNGAGKTTTILMLLGLTEASTGEVRILGYDPLREPLAVKQQVGYLPDSVGFYDNLTARENLRYTAALAGLDPLEADRNITDALSRVRLDDVADSRVRTFSHGMRQRLGLAELLMRECRILILDEPTSGLDPQSTEELLALIRGFAAEGMTVLVSSHLLDIVQSICTRVALFNKGRIGFVGTLAELAAKVSDAGFEIELEAHDADIAKLAGEVGDVRTVTPLPTGGWRVSAERDIRPELASRIVNAGGALTRIEAHRVGLGEAYNLYFKEAAQ